VLNGPPVRIGGFFVSLFGVSSTMFWYFSFATENEIQSNNANKTASNIYLYQLFYFGMNAFFSKIASVYLTDTVKWISGQSGAVICVFLENG